jgi:hypothetical protein
MIRIVTTQYRYKRPPRKRKPAVPLEGPAIVTIRDKKRVAPETPEKIILAEAEPQLAPPKSTPAPTGPRKSAIATIRRKPERVLPPGLLPTPEEHRRRGDGADAMFQEMKRLIEEAVAKEKPALPLRPVRRQRRP